MNPGPLDSLYREVVLDHHRHPRGDSPLENYDVQASGKNPSCGDEVTLQLRFDGDRIAGIGVLSRGCAISTSSGSMLAEILDGLTLAEAEQIAHVFRQELKGEAAPAEVDLGDLEALTGVRKFPVRIKCALLPWVTLLDAILAHRQGRAPGEATTEGGDGNMTVSVKNGG
ncbi:MAG: Fe-S cluster assembly sulfur transfer protein SufU [bacterium]